VIEPPAEAWARCAPYLTAALDRSGNEATLDDVKARIEAGSAWFWPGEKSAAVVEITRSAHFWLLGGDLREVLERQDDGVNFARSMNCDRITVRGRPGWARVLKPYGYRPLTDLVRDMD
jgi:hypothetical protein